MQLSLAAMGISQSEKARGRGQAIIADAMAGMPPNSIHKFQGTPVSFTVSVDRRLFAAALAEGGVQILDRNSSDIVGRHDAGRRLFLGVTFSADGEALLFYDVTDQTVMHWRWWTGQPQTLGKLEGAASFARSPTGDAFYGTATFDPCSPGIRGPEPRSGRACSRNTSGGRAPARGSCAFFRAKSSGAGRIRPTGAGSCQMNVCGGGPSASPASRNRQGPRATTVRERSSASGLRGSYFAHRPDL